MLSILFYFSFTTKESLVLHIKMLRMDAQNAIIVAAQYLHSGNSLIP